MKRALVLAGGPDAEHDVSLASARTVADALGASGLFAPELRVIERLDADELRAIDTDVIVPVLHGSYGEGGPLQDLLEADGRPYVGSGPRAARLAMDKMATKLAAASLGLRTLPSHLFDPRDLVCPFDLPVVAKPVHDGSSCGLHVCRTQDEWSSACSAMAASMRTSPRTYMIEPCLKTPSSGRELTVGLLDELALPVIEIEPNAEATDGVYTYEAKYQRDDTRYSVRKPDDGGPEALPSRLLERVTDEARRIGNAIGVRHLARVDFILDEDLEPFLLEVNTMPGFTEHSLVPMGARAAGIELPALCARLAERALGVGASVA